MKATSIHIADLHLPDADDRHVLAAAIEADADYIVTRDTDHFPIAALAAYDIQRRSPDELVCELIDVYGAAPVCEVLRNQAAVKKRPPMTLPELLERLARPSQGLQAAMSRIMGACT